MAEIVYKIWRRNINSIWNKQKTWILPTSSLRFSNRIPILLLGRIRATQTIISKPQDNLTTEPLKGKWCPPLCPNLIRLLTLNISTLTACRSNRPGYRPKQILIASKHRKPRCLWLLISPYLITIINSRQIHLVWSSKKIPFSNLTILCCSTLAPQLTQTRFVSRH